MIRLVAAHSLQLGWGLAVKYYSQGSEILCCFDSCPVDAGCVIDNLNAYNLGPSCLCQGILLALVCVESTTDS